MQMEGNVFRPPVEAGTFILQVTAGCTHNTCRFCTMYRDKEFHMIDESIVEENLKEAQLLYRSYGKKVYRIFLADGDVFALSADRLEKIIMLIRKYFPELETVAMYASVSNVKNKSDQDLMRLKELGVGDLYIGHESGLNDALAYMRKGQTVEDSLEQMQRLNETGIVHHALMIIGMAGKGRGKESGKAAAELLNQIRPGIALLTTLSVFPGSDLEKDVENGIFVPAGEKEILEEEKIMLENIEIPEMYFWANHVLNSTPIEGFVGKCKRYMLSKLQHSIDHMDEKAFEETFRRTHL